MRVEDCIGLDFETYSGTDLASRGLYNYVSCSTFQPLIANTTTFDLASRTYYSTSFDFVHGGESAVDHLRRTIGDKYIVAHNAGFERLVLRALGLDYPASRFIDSAVLARAMGAGSRLEAAAPQLLGVDKLDDGRRLVRLFCVPSAQQKETGELAFDPQVIDQNPVDWKLLDEYCGLDSELSLRILHLAIDHLVSRVLDLELKNQAVTMDMNDLGWFVDVPLVEEMQRRYLENVDRARAEFLVTHDPFVGTERELNLNSLKQLKEWCADRGIKATSFDEKHVARLHKRISAKLDSVDAGNGTLKRGQYEQYCEVLSLLETKKVLGGSSLKKLQVILDTTGRDCRLRDQYLHLGAGQTFRTTGRSVQMQNLKRLSEPADMSELDDLDSEWDNTRLAENIRQVFTSSHPSGQLIVGDFSSVESRGLAWLAGATDKLDSFRQGLDIYKVGAAKQYGTTYDQVTKDQRQFGKVGELSCGYGAGGGAVQAFAENMGVLLTEGEANQLVFDWRDANPLIVDLWRRLDAALDEALSMSSSVKATMVKVGAHQDHTVHLSLTSPPVSLTQQVPGILSLSMTLLNSTGSTKMQRVFHGIHRRGNNICYFRPSDRKTGDLWRDTFTDPKTKETRFFTLYGGKLSGILTQSLCREIFFQVLRATHSWVQGHANLDLVGQFHDEICLDWRPGGLDLAAAKNTLHTLMTTIDGYPRFPMAAEVKNDYRYTK